MSGKELALALVGAAVVGGAAGVVASVCAAPKAEAPAADPSADLAYRLKTTEDELAKAKVELDDSVRSIRELQERVTSAELKAARTSGVTAALPPVGKPMRIVRGARAANAEPGPQTAEDVTEMLGGAVPEAITFDVSDALEDVKGELGGLGEQLGSLRAGLELRKLPEADRWQKAKDDLGLSWNQVEDLKKAIETRDAAMKEAVTTETKSGPNGGVLKIQRSDPGKAAHAEADYHDKVNATLDENQRKGWSAKGWDRAFGRSPFGGMGGNAVMSIGITSEVHGSDAKDAPKDAPK